MFLNTKGIVLAFKKHVRLFRKTRTCFGKLVRVFGDIMVIGGVRQRQ